MSTDQANNKRALPRYARASWGYALGGARLTAQSARTWAKAEGLEEIIKEKDARALRARLDRDARARAKKGKRAHPPMSAQPMSAHEIKARAFKTRALRTGCALTIPCALIAWPPLALINGDPGALILWPAAYAYLVWSGWDKRERPEEVPVITALDEPQEPRPTRQRNDLSPTAEEAAILGRIQTWDERAAERKLQEVFPGEVVIDESGMLIPVTFGGQWTPAKLDNQLDQFRSLLAVPDEVKTQFRPGGTADRVHLRVRTRIRDLDLAWTPERKGLGLNAETGVGVFIDLTDRSLYAGMSGAGKSVALRVCMAEVLQFPHTALVIIDLKVEGALWAHTARVEFKPEGIQSVLDDLVAEMWEREDIMRAQGLDKWEPTAERPRIIVVVDEGAEFMGWVPDAVDAARSLAVRARSAEIVLWWATQKPTVTGPGKGLDSMMSAQFTTQVCMAVAGPNEARNVLGEDATAKGWHPEDLLKGGWAMVRVQGENSKPDPVRVWHMTKEHVKALPAREAWRRPKPVKSKEVPEALAVALHLSKDSNGVSTTRIAAALNIRDTEVHGRMREFGCDPEPNAFAIEGEGKARGYRRLVLEDALQRWETT